MTKILFGQNERGLTIARYAIKTEFGYMMVFRTQRADGMWTCAFGVNMMSCVHTEIVEPTELKEGTFHHTPTPNVFQFTEKKGE